MRHRIVLKPMAVEHGSHWRAAIERYADGVLIHTDRSPHVFDDECAASNFAETQAMSIIDELLHEFGHSFTFTVVHRSPDTGTMIPGFLNKEYRRGL